MGRKRKTVLNQNIKKEEPIIEKEVVEQEVHIENINAQSLADEFNENNSDKLEKEEQPTNDNAAEEVPNEIVPEPIIQKILDYYPEKNNEEKVEPRSLKSLSKAEFRYYLRTGVIPK